MKVEQQVQNICESYIKKHNLFLHEVKFIKHNKDVFLRVTIDDKELKYLKSEDITNFTRFLNTKLDEEDFIEEHYVLDVQSLGINKEIKDYSRLIYIKGEEISISVKNPINGEKNFYAKLVNFNDNWIEVSIKDVNIKINKDQIKKIIYSKQEK